METAKDPSQCCYVSTVTGATNYETPESNGIAPHGNRLGNVIDLSRREMYPRKPARDVDLFHYIRPIIHRSRDTNDNTLFRQVKQCVFSKSHDARGCC